MIEINYHSIRSRVITCMKETPSLIYKLGAMVHRRLVYIYLLNVPSFSSRYFNKIKRTSRLGRLLALSLEILVKSTQNIQTLKRRGFSIFILTLTSQFTFHMFSSCSVQYSVKMTFWYFITCFKYSIRNFQKRFHQTVI